jgi:hypothetical protein
MNRLGIAFFKNCDLKTQNPVNECFLNNAEF